MTVENVEHDPFSDLKLETNENQDNNQTNLDANVKQNFDDCVGPVSVHKAKKDIINLPNYFFVTNLPNEGPIYTCEFCGRTFTTAKPASLHRCNSTQ